MAGARQVLLGVALVLLGAVLPADAVVHGRANGSSCPATSGGLDIVDGGGTIQRHALVALPNGVQLDLDGTLTFTMVLADTSCSNGTYALEVYGTSPLGVVGAPLQLLGSESLQGDGQPSVRFSVSYRDYAAVRDPVDLNGGDRCVYVVGTVMSRGVVRDRAPDVGTYTVCPGDIAITQSPFS